MYLFSCDLLLILSLASSLGSLMVSDSAGLYLIRVQQKGLFKYKLWEWQHTGSMCRKMDAWKRLVSGEGWEEVTACHVSSQCKQQMGTLPAAQPDLWATGHLQTPARGDVTVQHRCHSAENLCSVSELSRSSEPPDAGAELNEATPWAAPTGPGSGVTWSSSGAPQWDGAQVVPGADGLVRDAWRCGCLWGCCFPSDADSVSVAAVRLGSKP